MDWVLQLVSHMDNFSRDREYKYLRVVYLLSVVHYSHMGRLFMVWVPGVSSPWSLYASGLSH